MKMQKTLLGALALCLSLRADEGMWTFDNLPLKKMQAAYGFSPDQAWLDHVRLSALHFGGGSGSFVSAEGLVITNHHVGRGWVQQVSGPGDKDYIKLGFLARTRAEELKIPGMTLRTLVQMENVTDLVNASVKPGMGDKEGAEARERTLKALVAERDKATGLAFSPVTLYQGGEFWLYGYKVHKDIRLVMAPEGQIAAFGGDPDNFTYPRHDLDFTLFRVYENDKPYTPSHFLKWGTEGVKLGDLTLVVGHPGSTQRLNTFAQMLFARDTALATRIATMEQARKNMQDYAAKSPEHARQVKTRIYGIENGLKAMKGYLSGFKQPEAIEAIRQKEVAFRQEVAKHPELQASAGESWTKIEQALQESATLTREALLVNTRGSAALQTALTLVRLIEEPAKPQAERLKGFRTEEERKASLESLKRTPRGANAELDQFNLERALNEVVAGLEPQHPFRKALLGERTPQALATVLNQSKVTDEAFRQALLKGGLHALAASEDPAVRIARLINPMLTGLAQRQENVQALIAEHAGRIAKARFAVYGKSLYPDATLTLRLTYGPVKTYAANGTLIQPFTTFHGLFDRALAWGPEAEKGAWALPPRWLERKDKLDLATPFNFVHQVDIIGGNSGSPVLNTKGEFVGVIFDGNIEMLPGNFFYDGSVNRGVTLDARAIREALAKVYDASFLVDELLGKR